MGFNILITPIFWLALEKYIFTPDLMKCATDKTIENHPFCRYVVFSEAMIHFAPMVCSLIEIMCTKMVFLHGDSWYMFGAGITYTAFNGIGCLVLKTTIYPYPLDWKTNWKLTLFCYFLQAPVLYFINECIATCTQKRRPVDAGLKDQEYLCGGVVNTTVTSINGPNATQRVSSE